MRPVCRRFLYCAICVLFLCAGILLGTFLWQMPALAAIDQENDGHICMAAEACEAAMRATVSVSARGAEGKKSGSGVIWKEDGEGNLLVLTCAHVTEGSHTISVYLWGRETERYAIPAVCVGTDPAFDVAVLSFSLPKWAKDGEVTAATQKTESVRYGEEVLACGNARGEGLSVSRGVISLPYEEWETEGEIRFYHRTDVAIAPGASGGGLFDAEGKLVGMLCFRVQPAGGENDEITRAMGYALPANTLFAVAEHILSDTERIVCDGIAFCVGESHFDGQKTVQTVSVIVNKNDTIFDKLHTGDRIEALSLNGKAYDTGSLCEIACAFCFLEKGDVLCVTVLRYGSVISLSFNL